MQVCVTPMELHAGDTAVSTTPWMRDLFFFIYFYFIFFLRRRCLWSIFLLIHKRGWVWPGVAFQDRSHIRTSQIAPSLCCMSILMVHNEINKHTFDYITTAEHRGPAPHPPARHNVPVELISDRAADKLAKRALTRASECIRLSLGLEAIC